MARPKHPAYAQDPHFARQHGSSDTYHDTWVNPLGWQLVTKCNKVAANWDAERVEWAMVGMWKLGIYLASKHCEDCVKFK